jgi:predicted dienelactone hydrolase
MVVQTVIERPRWQMAPAYLATSYLFVVCWLPVTSRLAAGRWTAISCMTLFAAATVLGTVLPVFRLPEPTGRHAIGTVTLLLIDPKRKELRGSTPQGQRELMVQVWYPAESTGPGQAYRSRAEAALSHQHLTLVRTHAAEGVPSARSPERFPLIVFSPSWTGRRNQNSVQAEELASHGFIVVGMDHPYGTDLTLFPDGRTAKTTLGTFMDFSTEETLKAGQQAAEEELRVRTADARFVLDEMERCNRSDPAGLLTGRIDTSRVGIFGHSFGGAVAAEVCRTDSRFKAGLNYDGFIFGGALEKVIGKPFLVLFDDTPVPSASMVEAAMGRTRRELSFTAENVKCLRHALSGEDSKVVTVLGTRHMNFCDSSLYSSMRRITHTGPISPQRALEIINACTLSFFRKHLEGEDDRLLRTSPSRYPEVVIEQL